MSNAPEISLAPFARCVRWAQLLHELESAQRSLDRLCYQNDSPLVPCQALLVQITQKVWDMATGIYLEEEKQWLRQMKRTPKKSRRKNSARRKLKGS